MNPNLIEIKNFRSIDELQIPIRQLDDKTCTFGLVGVNEAGKSSILKAMSLMGTTNAPLLSDFRDNDTPIYVSITYELNSNTRDNFIKDLEEIPHIESGASYSNLIQFKVTYKYEPSDLTRSISYIGINLDGTEFSMLMVPETYLYRPIFWTSEEKYLISNPISLDQFSADPLNTSIPLRNCFDLANIHDIPRAINKISDSAEKQKLEKDLGKAVTQHISTVWPGHPIEITFSIDSKILNFHVNDNDSDAKAKKVSQRSDGFKQFISFLLTISAESKNEKLSRSILLIDEPETHLHPKAQIHLLNDLKEITKGNSNNLVFLATHSTFMIDKEDLSRNYRVVKNKDKTNIKQFSKDTVSYCAVNFEVFDIYSTDYHSELYGKLHDRFIEADLADEKRANIKPFDKGYFVDKCKLTQNKPFKGVAKTATLPTYIRNCINHPTPGISYTDLELKESTDLMCKLLAP